MKRTPAEREAFCEAAAARMMANPTQAESKMWGILEPLGFSRQVVVQGVTKNKLLWTYIVDFYHDKLCLAVECDGGVHKRQKGRDRRRDQRLRGEGIVTLRFANAEIMKHRDSVLIGVIEVMEKVGRISRAGDGGV